MSLHRHDKPPQKFYSLLKKKINPPAVSRSSSVANMSRRYFIFVGTVATQRLVSGSCGRGTLKRRECFDVKHMFLVTRFEKKKMITR